MTTGPEGEGRGVGDAQVDGERTVGESPASERAGSDRSEGSDAAREAVAYECAQGAAAYEDAGGSDVAPASERGAGPDGACAPSTYTKVGSGGKWCETRTYCNGCEYDAFDR